MINVCRLDDLPPGEVLVVTAAGARIAVFNADGTLYAVDDTCTHQKAFLSDGWLDGCTVECPLHATQFDLRTGRPLGPPAKTPVRTHQVLVADDVVYLRLSEDQPAGEPQATPCRPSLGAGVSG